MMSRFETFCDGVFAIAITLLVLEIRIPPPSSIHSIGEFWHEVLGDWPSWFGFALSFCIILVSWVNHHNFLKLIKRSSARFIYANGFMLFTVAAIPYSTGLMSEYMLTDYAQPAITIYCFGILLHNISWFLFHRTALHPVPLTKDENSRMLFEKNLVKSNEYAFLFYLALCILSFWLPFVSMILMTLSWTIWIVIAIRVDPGEEK